MNYTQQFCTWALVLACAVAAFGKPNREIPSNAISVKNAADVVKIDEVRRDVWRIVWIPKSREVAFLTWEQPVEILEMGTLKRVRVLAEGRKPVHFAISHDAKIVAWSENGSTKVQVQDLHSGKELNVDAKQAQSGIAFSPDGKWLATGGYGAEAKLWNAKSGELAHSLEVPPKHVKVDGGLTVAFSPNGNNLAVGNRNHVTRLYEVETGKLLHTLDKRMTHEIRFSPDGKVLAATYVDGSIGIWDVGKGNLLKSFQAKAEELYSLDWSPKGDVVATAGRNAKITLWDANTLTLLKELESPEWVIQVRFSPDGTRLLTAGGSLTNRQDRKVTIWGLPDGK
jgi:WD40 repeat protein